MSNNEEILEELQDKVVEEVKETDDNSMEYKKTKSGKIDKRSNKIRTEKQIKAFENMMKKKKDKSILNAENIIKQKAVEEYKKTTIKPKKIKKPIYIEEVEEDEEDEEEAPVIIRKIIKPRKQIQEIQKEYKTEPINIPKEEPVKMSKYEYMRSFGF
tara:strand:+ start:55 stop:525 length:471 start_codon:yes stop_codon:yes gene_type:complete